MIIGIHKFKGDFFRNIVMVLNSTKRSVDIIQCNNLNMVLFTEKEEQSGNGQQKEQ